MKLVLKYTAVFTLAILALSSCVSHKKMVYVEDKELANLPDSVRVYKTQKQENLIRESDELYIQVTSIDIDQYNFFQNQAESSRILPRTPSDFSLVSYQVDDEGYIMFPLINQVHVSGLSTKECEEKLHGLLTDYLNQPKVKVNFVNKDITVLGYVENPGKYYFTDDNLSIFDALSLAGERDHYGNINKVKIIREINDEIQVYVVDLGDKNIFKSERFYVQSGDIVYVEPLKARKWGITEFPFGLILQGLTTAILSIEFYNRYYGSGSSQ